MQQRPRKGGCRLTELPEGRLGGVAARTVGGRADLVELLGELLRGGRARGDRLLGQIEHELEGVLGGRDDLAVWLLHGGQRQPRAIPRFGSNQGWA